MLFLKKSWKWIDATDTAVSWADRLLRVFGVSAGLGVMAGVIAWIVQNFYAALVVGLVVWLAVLMGLLARTTKGTEAQVPLTENRQTGATTPPRSLPDRPSLLAVLRNEHFPDEQYPFATSEELGAEAIRDRSIFLSDLVVPGERIISDRIFDNCQIFGPAVITPLSTSWPFQNCTWSEYSSPTETSDSDAIVSERPLTLMGSIGVREDCFFRRCHFIDVGVMVWIGLGDRARKAIASGEGEGGQLL